MRWWFCWWAGFCQNFVESFERNWGWLCWAGAEVDVEAEEPEVNTGMIWLAGLAVEE